MQTTWKKLALGLGVSGGLMLQTCTANVTQALSDAALAGFAAAVESTVNTLVSNALLTDDD